MVDMSRHIKSLASYARRTEHPVRRKEPTVHPMYPHCIRPTKIVLENPEKCGLLPHRSACWDHSF